MQVFIYKFLLLKPIGQWAVGESAGWQGPRKSILILTWPQDPGLESHQSLSLPESDCQKPTLPWAQNLTNPWSPWAWNDTLSVPDNQTTKIHQSQAALESSDPRPQEILSKVCTPFTLLLFWPEAATVMDSWILPSQETLCSVICCAVWYDLPKQSLAVTFFSPEWSEQGRAEL